jgi:hypothetical protein
MRVEVRSKLRVQIETMAFKSTLRHIATTKRKAPEPARGDAATSNPRGRTWEQPGGPQQAAEYPPQQPAGYPQKHLPAGYLQQQLTGYQHQQPPAGNPQ